MQAIFTHLASLYTSYIASALPFVLLLIFLVDTMVKSHYFKISYRIIRFALIVNWILIVLYWIINLDGLIIFTDRATGPYAMTYWLMLIASLILPVLLLFKRTKDKKWLLFIIAFFSQLGVYMEPLVIIITSYHADKLWGPPLLYLGSVAIRPFVYACFLLAMDYILFRNKEKTEVDYSNNQADDILDNNN